MPGVYEGITVKKQTFLVPGVSVVAGGGCQLFFPQLSPTEYRRIAYFSLGFFSFLSNPGDGDIVQAVGQSVWTPASAILHPGRYGDLFPLLFFQDDGLLFRVYA